MGCVTTLLLMISILVLVLFDIFMWTVSGLWGLVGIIAIISFIIAYAVSDEFSLSPKDFFWNSEWGVFCKKIVWVWGVALMVYAGGTMLLWFIKAW